MGQDIIGLIIDYGTHEDTLEVEINTNDGSYNSEDVGAMHSLLSKNGISVDTTGGELHGISVSQNESGAYTHRYRNINLTLCIRDNRCK